MALFAGVISLDTDEGIRVEGVTNHKVYAVIPARFITENQLFDEARESFSDYHDEVSCIEVVIQSILALSGISEYVAGTIHDVLYRLCVPGPGGVFDLADFAVALEQS
jgi:hypothetical protein